MVVARRGQLGSLWGERHAIAAALGGWLGGFDEVAWQQPHTFIGFYDGPLKGRHLLPRTRAGPRPRLRAGVGALFDPDGVADRLAEQARAPRPSPDLSGFDVHAWDWLWFLQMKLRHGGNEWLVYVEPVKFVETMLVAGYNAMTAGP